MELPTVERCLHPGLVFQGTRTGYLKVYDALTGKKLKEIFTGTGIMAIPTTYLVDGEQYITVMAGYGGAPTSFYSADAALFEYQNNGRVLAFRLNGGNTRVPSKQPKYDTPPPPEKKINAELIAKGSVIYYNYCETCHGGFGKGHFAQHPDLSKMPQGRHDLFTKIVLEGYLSSAGMADFSNSLTKEDVEAIHHYLIRLQREQYDNENAKRN